LMAHAAAVRLLTDLVNDSPTPDVALLAAEELPRALGRLGTDARAAGLSGPDYPRSGPTISLAEACAAEGLRVSSFRRRWHGAVACDQLNLIPHTGDRVLARASHDRVIRSLWAAGLCVGAWLTLGVTCLVCLVVVGVTRPPGDACPTWRWHRGAAWISSAVVCGPLIALLLVVAAADLPFTWLISYPSLPTATAWPGLFVLTVGLASRVCVRPAGQFDKSPIPMAAVGALALALLAIPVTGALLLPVHSEAWRPPAGVQRFRQLGLVFGVECVAITVAWMAWGSLRRRRAGSPPGAWAHANLGAASAALLAVSVLSLMTLGINQRCDLAHQEAFARAAADPLTDRLGHTWRQDYFEGGRAALSHIQSSC